MLPCLLALLFCVGAALAQDGGQVCLLAYLDANRNSLRDAGEIPLTRGLGADLTNKDSLTIDSRLLETSPFAADGILCFDDLPAGSYRLRMTSAEYAATASEFIDAAVSPGEPPPRVDVGFEPIFVSAAAPPAWTIGADMAVDLLAAAAAFLAAVALAGMACALPLLTRKRRRQLRPAPGDANH